MTDTVPAPRQVADGPPAGGPAIVLIHGFWVTSRSWGEWEDHYEARGHRVLAPAYPGLEVEVEALGADRRRSPS